MEEKEDNNVKNIFKTKDENIKKETFNNKWIEIINLCEKGLVK